MKSLKICLLLGLTLTLSACATITGRGTDNTPPPSPLVSYKAQFSPQRIWSSQAGKGTDGKYLNLIPAISGNAVYISDAKGLVTALNLQTGKTLWQSDLKVPLAAGPGVGEGIIVVGGNQADMYALNQTDGKIRWHVNLSDQVTSVPVIANGRVVVKTLDGHLWALNTDNGAIQWQQTHNVPVMVLAGGSQALIIGNKVITGYADGKLAAYSLVGGTLLWTTAAANPQGVSDVEQMIDITATPAAGAGDVMYVVTYQGNLSAVNVNTGNIIWAQPLSSYTGLALSAQSVFVTDAAGSVYAFNRTNGQKLWQQDNLKYRKLTAPVVMGNTVIVADGEGYLHWLSQSDGSTIARVAVDRNTPVTAAPVITANQVYVLNTKGKVAGYK
jgi:outer membrane protein assembly factor BamB